MADRFDLYMAEPQLLIGVVETRQNNTCDFRRYGRPYIPTYVPSLLTPLWHGLLAGKRLTAPIILSLSWQTFMRKQPVP